MGRKVKVSSNGKCSVAMYCKSCSERFELTGFSSEQNDRLYRRDETREMIQDIIPEVPVKWRELFVTGWRPDCWNKMLGL